MYGELRRLADKYMRGEAGGHTLQATALVHEAYARLAGTDIPLRNRAHFLAFMARLMRQVLVDYARARKSLKRGVDHERVTLDESVVVSTDSDALVLQLDEVLEELRAFDELKCQIIELRYFAGFSMDEIARTLDVSQVTVRRELRMAEAWLHHQMESG